ncbi:hypothetical protein EDEG_01291 [Edhazardia aedis USNM 41457]|uniref:Uncharacterized protein n=1 Tax=Edhazardia aedis (strain USNM 41457) TaxID=1003232 RepID=J9DT55_EDHAE|nr:hypothetical protein EDEG_01291 [Edhazardia aedis USNM 41457]|eukprot:EJW04487.1 hypothetical protein EDEG_01291 [Edhazardia aedis USNM 41457]
MFTSFHLYIDALKTLLNPKPTINGFLQNLKSSATNYCSQFKKTLKNIIDPIKSICEEDRNIKIVYLPENIKKTDTLKNIFGPNILFTRNTQLINSFSTYLKSHKLEFLYDTFLKFDECLNKHLSVLYSFKIYTVQEILSVGFCVNLKIYTEYFSQISENMHKNTKFINKINDDSDLKPTCNVPEIKSEISQKFENLIELFELYISRDGTDNEYASIREDLIKTEIQFDYYLSICTKEEDLDIYNRLYQRKKLIPHVFFLLDRSISNLKININCLIINLRPHILDFEKWVKSAFDLNLYLEKLQIENTNINHTLCQNSAKKKRK